MSDEQEWAAVRALDFVRPASEPQTIVTVVEKSKDIPYVPLAYVEISQEEWDKIRVMAPFGSVPPLVNPPPGCSCAPHNADIAPVPCPRKHALTDCIAAARVQEGPAYQYDLGDDVQPAQYPFAYRLWKHLHRHGAVCAFEEAQFRGKITSHSKSGEPWVQIHVATDEPEALGDRIMASVGGNITFGELAIPDYNGMSWAGYQRSGGVWVRHFGDYQLKWDAVIQRWDVLVARSK